MCNLRSILKYGLLRFGVRLLRLMLGLRWLSIEIELLILGLGFGMKGLLRLGLKFEGLGLLRLDILSLEVRLLKFVLRI